MKRLLVFLPMVTVSGLLVAFPWVGVCVAITLMVAALLVVLWWFAGDLTR